MNDSRPFVHPWCEHSRSSRATSPHGLAFCLIVDEGRAVFQSANLHAWSGGAQTRGEDGVACAVEIIEDFILRKELKP